jgi:Arc/MetJ-type ribon-helix-helix transcriptional regulator
MQLAQKLSVSLDPALVQFVDEYSARNAAKSRSAVVNQALRLMQQHERDSALELAYAQSAPADRLLAQEFAASLADGLGSPDTQAW